MPRLLVNPLLILLTVVGGLVVGGCSSTGDSPGGAAPGQGADLPAACADGGADGGGCAVDCSFSPREGCPCAPGSAPVDCGEVKRYSGSSVSCSLGKRSCGPKGAWGACIGDSVSTKSVPTAPGLSEQGLGSSSPCTNNPCDPYCKNIIDDPSGLDASAPLAINDGGLSLSPYVQQPGSFVGLTSQPNPGVITVTQIPSAAAPVTNPSPLQLQAYLIPSMGGMTPTAAVWTLSNYDTTLINAMGQVSVYVPVARSLTATAQVGSFSAVSKVQVVVNANEVDPAVPQAIANLFTGPGGAPDPATVLYPYNNTVFPRQITAPVVQWNNNGAVANAVKVTLRFYDAAAGADFTWSRILPESNPPQYALGNAVWAPFDQTASGKTGQIKLQRVVGGVLRQEQVINVTFSTQPLKGTVYYWEINNGRVAKLDTFTGTRTAAWLKPWAGQGRCVACHSVSADGTTIVVQEDGGNGPGGVYDAATGNQTYDRSNISAQWQALSPKAEWTIWGDDGNLSQTKNSGVYTSLHAALNNVTGYDTGSNIVAATFSPDGQHVAFSSRTAGWGAWAGWLWGAFDNNTFGHYTGQGRYGYWLDRPNQPWDSWPPWDYGYWFNWDVGNWANNGWAWSWGNGWGYRYGGPYSGVYWNWGYSGLGSPWYYDSGFGVSSGGWTWGGAPWGGWGLSINPDNVGAGFQWWGTNFTFGTGYSTGLGWSPFWYVDYNASSMWVADFVPNWPYFVNVRQVVASDVNRPVITYPTFTPDSQWIAFQRANRVRTRSNRGELWVVSLDGSKQVPLTNATGVLAPGQLTYGGDQSVTYEPTFNPDPGAGADYNWLVYISNRSYGNTIPPCGSQPDCGTKQMWVSAIDKNVTNGVDPSHPGFWLPGQQINNQNMRGFWAKSACSPVGQACAANEDCCQTGNPQQINTCRINQPISYPLQHSCVTTTVGVCSPTGSSCGSDTDCCKFGMVPGDRCIAGSCQVYQPQPTYSQGIYTRDYPATCPNGSHVVWRFFNWQSVTPGDSNIQFSAQTADTVAALMAAPSVSVGTASGAPTMGWVGQDVDPKLKASGQVSLNFLRITATLNPSSDKLTAPSLLDWRQDYDCAPSE